MQFCLRMVVFGKMVKMNEEFITKSILRFLKEKRWIIYSFDYPQSGMGYIIHQNDRSHKNKKTVIPDIIAHKNSTCIIMENKPIFYPDDFSKLDELSNSGLYSNDLENLISELNCNKILYGVGLPNTIDIFNKDSEILNLVDFIITVDNSKNCEYFLI